jgi:hypothetical protein
VLRVDTATGRRGLVHELHIAGPVGAGGLTGVHVSVDGASVVCTSDRYFSDLLLIEGLR